MVTAMTHLAYYLPAAGAPAELIQRATPTPGPGELLIETKAVALNPLDWYQRGWGFHIKHPAVIGSDVAGIVIATGTDVPAGAPKVGARVLAMAPSFYSFGKPDYGALQEKVVVSSADIMELPDSMSFVDAATFPMAILTAWSGWYSIGLRRDTSYTAADKKCMLVWGGASSIGGMAVQTAKTMGYTVFASASPKNFDYVKSLGAAKVFDYHDTDVVEQIVRAAKEDGLSISTGFDSAGDMKSCHAILKEFGTESEPALLSEARPFTPEQEPITPGVMMKFIVPPENDIERAEFVAFIFAWLKQHIADGSVVPSPPARVVEGGLAGVDAALDILQKGVSCEKLVVEI
ncbi:chaperonin 10-like protein [Limtongia smithiae]|uniref:chaperonin 10-like protein n=1 Tax=Limtongia smithiae TaxID=1125753 RepID=UPI0034CF6A7B